MDVELLVDRYLLDRRYKAMLAEEEGTCDSRETIRRPLNDEVAEAPGWASRLIRSLFRFGAGRDI